jgi:branched-chain amino acid transport system ATP-binding protein
MSAGILLSLSNVSKRFGGIIAVSQLDLHVQTGEILGLIGPNGAGKSTLLKLITGFEQADAGSIVFDHEDISGLPPHRICHRGIAITFQQPLGIQNLCVFDLLAVAAHNRSLDARSVLARVKITAEKFRLNSMLDCEAGRLDYGALRRLDFARAVATGCKLLLLDEPFAGQDNSDSDFLSSILDELRQEGLTIVVADHIIARLEALCDRLAFMDAGRMVKIGRPSEVLSDTEVRKSYLGDK